MFLFVVFTYLALFRLDELGIDVFRKMVLSQDINKMYRVSGWEVSDAML